MITKKGPGIDVAVVLFFKPKEIPSKVRIRDFTMPLANKIPGFITGLSGQQGLLGMMHARAYADAKHLEMIVVDLFVELDLPLYPKVLKSEDLPNVDLLNLNRTSKDLIEWIGDKWKTWILADSSSGSAPGYDFMKVTDFVARRPEYLPRLLREPAFKHLHLVTHPVITAFHPTPLTATSLPLNYPKIKSATARLHPDIEVVL